MKKHLIMLLMVLVNSLTFAQSQTDVAMDQVWVTSGKMYVVVSCVLVLFTILLYFLFSMDKKLKKIEKSMTEKI